MKNFSHVKILFLLLFLSYGNLLLADKVRPRTVKTNWITPMYPFSEVSIADPNLQCLQILAPDFDLSFKVVVTTASLDLNDIPPIYVSYDFNGNVGVFGPIDPSNFDRSYLYGEEYEIYEWSQLFNFKVEPLCLANQIAPFQISYSLVKETETGYMIYPIEDYPEVFPPIVYELAPPSNQVQKQLCCPEMLSTTNNFNSEISSNVELGKEFLAKNGDSSIQTIAVAPNPFTESFYIDYSFGKQEEVTINLLDVNGKSITSITQDLEGKGKYNLSLENKNIPSGLYIVHIKTKTESRIIKIIKSR